MKLRLQGGSAAATAGAWVTTIPSLGLAQEAGPYKLWGKPNNDESTCFTLSPEASEIGELGWGRTFSVYQYQFLRF